MKYNTVITFAVLIFSLFSFNCATIIKGYEDTVVLKNAPDSLHIITNEGAEIKVHTTFEYVFPSKAGDSIQYKGIKRISLRSNKEHTLHLKYHGRERILTVYPKIGVGWAFLDIICLGVPVIFDMYTGNWNRFLDIDVTF